MRIMTGGAGHHAIMERQRVVGGGHGDIHHVFPGGDALGVAMGAEGGQWFNEIVGAGRR